VLIIIAGFKEARMCRSQPKAHLCRRKKRWPVGE